MRDDEVRADAYDEVIEQVRFAEAVGLRVFWVNGLKEGTLYLRPYRVLLLDAALTVGKVRRMIDAAIALLT